MTQRQYSRSFIWRVIDFFLIFWAYQAFVNGDYIRAALYGIVGGGSLIYDFYQQKKYGEMLQHQRYQQSTYTQTGPSIGNFASKPNLRPYIDPNWVKEYNNPSLIKERGLSHITDQGNVEEKIKILSHIDNEFVFQSIYLNATEEEVKFNTLKYIEDQDFLKFLAVHNAGSNPELLFSKIDDINFKIDLLQLDNYRYKDEIITTITDPKQKLHVAMINLKEIIAIKPDVQLELLESIKHQQYSYQLIDLAIKQYELNDSWTSVIYTSRLAKNLPDTLRIELVQSIFNVPKFQDHPGYFVMMENLLQKVNEKLLIDNIVPNLQRLYQENSYSFSLLRYLHEQIPNHFSLSDKTRLLEMLLNAEDTKDFTKSVLITLEYEDNPKLYQQFVKKYPQGIDNEVIAKIGGEGILNHILDDMNRNIG